MSARTSSAGHPLRRQDGNGPSKSLLRVREIITMGAEAFNTELEKMKKLGGIIGRAAFAMDKPAAKRTRFVLSSAEAQTSFLDGPEMERVLKGSDFRLRGF